MNQTVARTKRFPGGAENKFVAYLQVEPKAKAQMRENSIQRGRELKQRPLCEKSTQ